MGNLDFWRDPVVSRDLFTDPWSLFGGIDRSSPLKRNLLQDHSKFAPSCDVAETEGAFTLAFDIPGIDPKELDIEISNQYLTVSGERKQESSEEKDGVYRRERTFGSFRRSFELPDGTNSDAVDASYDNGVLKVVVPKSEKEKPRKVVVGADS